MIAAVLVGTVHGFFVKLFGKARDRLLKGPEVQETNADLAAENLKETENKTSEE